jgi:hypothetical protein
MRTIQDVLNHAADERDRDGDPDGCKMLHDAAQLLADMETLRDAAVAQAPARLGASIELAVSGNGEAWRVFMSGEPLTALSCETSFGESLNEAAEACRKNSLAR